MSASAPASFAGAPSENLRLAKLLRLALVADHDGEAIGALHALKRTLCSAGLDPHFVADAFLRGAQPDTPSISPDAEGDDRSLVHRRDRLTPKEAAFVESLTRWRGTISERQRVWLRDICDKLAEVASA
jgi:hypothetical protein